MVVWEKITDNFKMEIIYFVVNTSHKFVINNPNVEIQTVVPSVTARDSFQHQCVILDIFCDRAEIIQIHCAYII